MKKKRPKHHHGHNPEDVALLKILESQEEMSTNILELQKEVRHLSKQNAKLSKDVEEILVQTTPSQVKKFKLWQLRGDKAMPITGVQVGTSGTFQIGFVPPNGAPLTAGPMISVDDPLVVLSAVDGSNQFTAAVDASDVAATFNVTVSGVNGKGDTITAVFSVPILAAPPPQITDFTLDQIA